MVAHPGHPLGALEDGLAGVPAEIRGRLPGHQQLTDAVLLDLATRHGARLASFDRRVAVLLAADSAVREALEVVLVNSRALAHEVGGENCQ
jgi:hypothetical protein